MKSNKNSNSFPCYLLPREGLTHHSVEYVGLIEEQCMGKRQIRLIYVLMNNKFPPYFSINYKYVFHSHLFCIYFSFLNFFLVVIQPSMYLLFIINIHCQGYWQHQHITYNLTLLFSSELIKFRIYEHEILSNVRNWHIYVTIILWNLCCGFFQP